MSPTLAVRLTRISPTHHRFQVVGGESRELVTREFLFHDLLHYALESEAGIRGGFYGGLLEPTQGADEESMVTEMVVGALTGALKAEAFEPEAFVERLKDYLRMSGKTAPAWLKGALVRRVAERMRRLQGEWKATPFGGAMTLTFPPEAP